jgi:hypothetical protein
LNPNILEFLSYLCINDFMFNSTVAYDDSLNDFYYFKFVTGVLWSTMRSFLVNLFCEPEKSVYFAAIGRTFQWMSKDTECQ